MSKFFFEAIRFLCYWRGYDENHVIELPFAPYIRLAHSCVHLESQKMFFYLSSYFIRIYDLQSTHIACFTELEWAGFLSRAHIDICLLNVVYKPQFIRASQKNY